MPPVFLHKVYKEYFISNQKRVLGGLKLVRRKGPIHRTQKIMRAITNEELNTLINKLRFRKHKVLIYTLRFEGLRLEEGLKINVTDRPDSNYLDLKKGTITLNKQKNGNDGEIWFLRRKTLELLIPYIQDEWENIISHKGWIFWSTWSSNIIGHLKVSCIESLLHRYRKKLGWDDKIWGYRSNGHKKHIITFHSLKHEYSREVLKNMAKKWNRIDTVAAMYLTRHKSLGGLQPYINEIPEVKQYLVNELMN